MSVEADKPRVEVQGKTGGAPKVKGTGTKPLLLIGLSHHSDREQILKALRERLTARYPENFDVILAPPEHLAEQIRIARGANREGVMLFDGTRECFNAAGWGLPEIKLTDVESCLDSFAGAVRNAVDARKAAQPSGMYLVCADPQDTFNPRHYKGVFMDEHYAGPSKSENAVCEEVHVDIPSRYLGFASFVQKRMSGEKFIPPAAAVREAG